MQSSSAPGSQGCTCCTGCAAEGWTSQGFEAGSGVGGTWYWNRYPGARCDVESVEYSYSFDDDLQDEWEWTERYAGQPEILRYLEHVADRFDLRPLIEFDTKVTSATFDEATARWRVQTDRGDDLSARFVIMATGCLSSANLPAIPGLDRFAGPVLHTGRWPHEGVDFSGQRVAVVGTGSSGDPVDPDHRRAGRVARRVPAHAQLLGARRATSPLDPDELAAIKADYETLRAENLLRPVGFGSRIPMPEKSALEASAEERQRVFDEKWARGGFSFLGSFNDLSLVKDSNELAAEYVRQRIADVVEDPAVAKLLTPTNVIGCKRLCLDTNYFETFNRPNVTLVDVSTTPITEITETGLRVGDESFDVDCLVFATGFDAMTGSLLAIDIRGRGRRVAPRRVGRRPAHLPRPRRARLPEPVHDHRPREPVGADQHGRVDRAPRRLDHGVPVAPARRGPRHDRGRPSRPPTSGSPT